MNLWLVAQIAYAAVAWSIAARTVSRAFRWAGVLGKPLASTVRELRRAGRADALREIPARLDAEAFEPLFENDPDTLSGEALVAAGEDAVASSDPPIRMLRALATIGTMLGLLAAVATLRAGLWSTSRATLDEATARALDSAVAGFVTALPCWTAVALSQRRRRAARSEMELVVLALRAEPIAADAAAENATEPVEPPPKNG